MRETAWLKICDPKAFVGEPPCEESRMVDLLKEAVIEVDIYSPKQEQGDLFTGEFKRVEDEYRISTEELILQLDNQRFVDMEAATALLQYYEENGIWFISLPKSSPAVTQTNAPEQDDEGEF